jgi:hypothetical protein
LKSSAITALIALTLASASPAAAQIRFAGQSLGCFGEDCTPTLLSSADYLNFTGSSFDLLTHLDGSLTMSLGHFSWSTLSGEQSVNSPFTLFISFAYPTGIHPDPIYYGGVEGLVIRGKLNGVRVGESTTQLVFEPNQREYTFTGGQPNGTGSFTLTLPDTHIEPYSRSFVYGQISDATVTPEPISMVLMGSGLAGLALTRRRRKQQQQQDS